MNGYVPEQKGKDGGTSGWAQGIRGTQLTLSSPSSGLSLSPHPACKGQEGCGRGLGGLGKTRKLPDLGQPQPFLGHQCLF